MSLFSRLVCCAAPPATRDFVNAGAEERHTDPIQQAPAQPDSPPVKPRAPPSQTTISLVAASSTADAIASVLPPPDAASFTQAQSPRRQPQAEEFRRPEPEQLQWDEQKKQQAAIEQAQQEEQQQPEALMQQQMQRVSVKEAQEAVEREQGRQAAHAADEEDPLSLVLGAADHTSSADGLGTAPSEPPQAPTVQSAALASENSGSELTTQAAESAASPSTKRPSVSPTKSPAKSPAKAAGASPSSKTDSPSSVSSSVRQQEDETSAVMVRRNNHQARKQSATSIVSVDSHADTWVPPSVARQPPPPAELAAALANLGTALPVDPIADLNVIRAAAKHTPAVLQGQMFTLVPLLLRTVRAPRLQTARAAILTFKELFATQALGEALCQHVADDSGPTTSSLLALMQKATGADLNSKRISADANACLITMVECLPSVECINMLNNYCTSPKVHQRVRGKAAALVTATAYRLAVTDTQSMDKAVMSMLLKISEPLLVAGASCRQTAKKLAVVVYSAWANQPQLHVVPPNSPRKAVKSVGAGGERASEGGAQEEVVDVCAESWVSLKSSGWVVEEG